MDKSSENSHHLPPPPCATESSDGPGIPKEYIFYPDGPQPGPSHSQQWSNSPHSGYQYPSQHPQQPPPRIGYSAPSPTQQTENPSSFAQYADTYPVFRRHRTQNTGNSNQTYNGSRVHNKRNTDRRWNSNTVVHLHLDTRGPSTMSLTSPSQSSRSISPTSSQDNIPTPRSPPTSVSSSEAIFTNGIGKMKTQTPSQRYVSLLFGCGLGYPLWRPTPRRTEAGEEYAINIGDVGVVRDGLPFYTLFNIIQPKDSLANRDGVPEGVDPPCIIQARCITVDDKLDEKGRSYIRPQGSVESEDVQEGSDGSRIFNFTLASTHGALLLLPQGSVLKALELRSEFISRIQRYWHQWYDWAEQQGDLGDQQALYVVTGVEKCSTWAIAAWDSAVGSENLRPLSLKLTVDGSDGRCSWAYSTARCETQSLAKPTSSEADGILNQTVFIRGFWINRYGGSIGGSSPPPAPMDFEGDGGEDGENSGRNGDHDNHYGGNSRQQNHSSSSWNSSSPTTGRNSASSFGTGHSGRQSRPYITLDFPQSDVRIANLSSSGSSSVINNLAFELISNIDPSLLDAGCVAVSHDDDWTSIIRDSDEELPSEAEIIRRVSAELKYVFQGETIYTSRMSKTDKDLIQQSLVSVQNATTLTPLLIEFRETAELEPTDAIQTATNASVTASNSTHLSPTNPGKRKRAASAPNESTQSSNTSLPSSSSAYPHHQTSTSPTPSSRASPVPTMTNASESSSDPHSLRRSHSHHPFTPEYRSESRVSRSSIIPSVVLPYFRRLDISDNDMSAQPTDDPLLTLTLSSASFLDSTAHEAQSSFPLYNIKTEGILTEVSRSNDWGTTTQAASIKWPKQLPEHKSKGKHKSSDDAQLQVRGGRWKSLESFLSQSPPRKFAIPGYSHSFKWKSVGSTYWCVAASAKGPIAIFEPAVDGSHPKLIVYKTLHDKFDNRPMGIYRGVSLLLLDYLLVSALLLVTDLQEWMTVRKLEGDGESSSSGSKSALVASTSALQWRKILYGEPLYPKPMPASSSTNQPPATPTSARHIAKIMFGKPLYPSLQTASSDSSLSFSDVSDSASGSENESETEDPIPAGEEVAETGVQVAKLSEPPSPSAESVSYPLTTSIAPTHTYLDPLFYNEYSVPPVPKIPEQYASAKSSLASSPVTRGPGPSSWFGARGGGSRRLRELPRPPSLFSRSHRSQSTPRPRTADSAIPSSLSNPASDYQRRPSYDASAFIIPLTPSRMLPVPPRMLPVPPPTSPIDSTTHSHLRPPSLEHSPSSGRPLSSRYRDREHMHVTGESQHPNQVLLPTLSTVHYPKRSLGDLSEWWPGPHPSSSVGLVRVVSESDKGTERGSLKGSQRERRRDRDSISEISSTKTPPPAYNSIDFTDSTGVVASATPQAASALSQETSSGLVFGGEGRGDYENYPDPRRLSLEAADPSQHLDHERQTH
ncbi:hypothetical protein V5O48_017197 [Marasmius crinis-equi]|uniref:Uncharacterized protein n=1 Tax=Marasmius crinis-equi TaxID=585013 RepID=A0ABR3EPN2_9AGAR